MIKQIEVKAESVNSAVNKALLQLGLERDDVSIEVLEKENAGFLGIGRRPALVKVTYQTSPQDTVRRFLDGLLFRFGAPASMSIEEDAENRALHVQLAGENMGLVIGRRGDVLDAMQYLASIIANREEDEHWRVTLDTENYREKRELSLAQLADKMAKKALKYNKSVALEPMKPHERRVIHAALQDYEGITTYSTGSEPNRKVIIAPQGAAAPAQKGGQKSGAKSASGAPRRRRRRPSARKKAAGDTAAPQSAPTQE